MSSTVRTSGQVELSCKSGPIPWSFAYSPWVLLPTIVLGYGVSWVYTQSIPFAWVGAWVAQGLLVLLAVSHQPKTAFWLCYLAGFLSLGWAFHWAPHALEVCMDAPPWLSYLIFALLTAWESLPFALFACLVAYATSRGSRFLWIIPITWVALEHWWPRVFPWILGYSQLEALPLIQLADITGACGISFCVVAGASLPAAIAVYLRQASQAQDRRWFLAYVCGVAGLLMGVMTYGYLQLEHWKNSQAGQRTLRIAAVQVNIGQMGSEKKLLALTHKVSGQADLVCWPESAIGSFPAGLEQFRDDANIKRLSPGVPQLMRPTQGTHCEILAGGQSFPPHATEDGPFQMTAYLINKDEKILGTYHKRTLIPFGEYMPGEKYFPKLREWATLTSKIEPGKSAEPLVTSQGTKLGVIICYEDLLRGNVLEMARSGGEVLISLINDGSFEHPLTLEQHRRLAMLRAVEHRRYLVRCAGTGITCIVSPTGEVKAELPIHAEDVIVHSVILNDRRSIYALYGEWFPNLCSIALLAGIFSWGMGRRALEIR